MPAKIHYYDIGDYKTREEKLEILRNFKSIENVPWTSITPNERGDWINQRGEEFQKFIGIDEIFEIHSNGCKTNRDAWCYNFSKKKLAENMQQMIAFYNEQVDVYLERISWDKDVNVEDFVDMDATKISWSPSLPRQVKSGIKSEFLKQNIRPVLLLSKKSDVSLPPVLFSQRRHHQTRCRVGQYRSMDGIAKNCGRCRYCS
ncbi:MAG: hypothetical protein LBT89_05260 [Planctomycetaceae bacterium]|jgi:predicted helicase|nr:hypothetical protein [Planctomycetaceae bacterium]